MRCPTMLSTALLLLLTAVTSTSATPTQDLINLRESCENVTDVLNASVNNTGSVDTAYLLQSIGYQIGACLTNAGCIGNTVPPPAANSSSSDSNDSLDAVYLNYTSSLSDLASAVITRGRTMHAELNAPVSSALGSMANAVYAYGSCLSNGNLISQSANIRTWRAGSNIVEAETAWNDILNYPGRRRRVRRSVSDEEEREAGV